MGGRIRAETAVGEGAASVASVAVELARKIFGSLQRRGVLVLGAGVTAELVVKALGREGVNDVTVVNRTYDHAVDLAGRLRGRALRLQELSGALRDVDIVVTSTAAPHPVLRVPTFREAFPSGPPRPLLLVDIAIPRDVEPVLGEEPNVFLYNVDDLSKIVDETLERRRDAVEAAEAIIRQHADEFAAWYAGLEVVPVIRSIRSRADAARRAELERVLGALDDLDGPEREAVRELSRRLVNKLLHLPTVRLKEGAADGRAQELVDAARYLFGLEAEPPAPGPPPADGREGRSGSEGGRRRDDPSERGGRSAEGRQRPPESEDPTGRAPAGLPRSGRRPPDGREEAP